MAGGFQNPPATEAGWPKKLTSGPAGDHVFSPPCQIAVIWSVNICWLNMQYLSNFQKTTFKLHKLLLRCVIIFNTPHCSAMLLYMSLSVLISRCSCQAVIIVKFVERRGPATKCWRINHQLCRSGLTIRDLINSSFLWGARCLGEWCCRLIPGTQQTYYTISSNITH